MQISKHSHIHDTVRGPITTACCPQVFSKNQKRAWCWPGSPKNVWPDTGAGVAILLKALLIQEIVVKPKGKPQFLSAPLRIVSGSEPENGEKMPVYYSNQNQVSKATKIWLLEDLISREKRLPAALCRSECAKHVLPSGQGSKRDVSILHIWGGSHFPFGSQPGPSSTPQTIIKVSS